MSLKKYRVISWSPPSPKSWKLHWRWRRQLLVGKWVWTHWLVMVLAVQLLLKCLTALTTLIPDQKGQARSRTGCSACWRKNSYLHFGLSPDWGAHDLSQLQFEKSKKRIWIFQNVLPPSTFDSFRMFQINFCSFVWEASNLRWLDCCWFLLPGWVCGNWICKISSWFPSKSIRGFVRDASAISGGRPMEWLLRRTFFLCFRSFAGGLHSTRYPEDFTSQEIREGTSACQDCQGAISGLEGGAAWSVELNVTWKFLFAMAQTAQAPQAAQPSMSRHRMGEVNVMHNSVVQKLNIEAAWIQGLRVAKSLRLCVSEISLSGVWFINLFQNELSESTQQACTPCRERGHLNVSSLVFPCLA